MSTEETKRLERRRKVVQARLLRAVDELDARAHQVQHDVKQIGATAQHLVVVAKKRAVPTLVGAAAVVTFFGLSAWAFGVAIGRRRHRTMTDRLADKVRQLDLVPRPSFLRQAAEKVALAFVSYAATQAARHLTQPTEPQRLNP